MTDNLLITSITQTDIINGGTIYPLAGTSGIMTESGVTLTFDLLYKDTTAAATTSTLTSTATSGLAATTGVTRTYTATQFDQYGDTVDLYDFASQGVPVVLDIGTPWCSPCKSIAAYLATGDEEHIMWERDGVIEPYPWWDESYTGLDQLVANGEVYWITILFSESESHGPITTVAEQLTVNPFF